MNRILLAFAFLFSLVLAACGPSGDTPKPSTAKSNNPDAGLIVFRRGNGSEPDSLDPQKAQGTWEANIIGEMILGLTTEGPDGLPVAGSADHWETSADGLVWTFHIRDNMNWSDGTPVTADDFVYALRRILDPKTEAQYASFVYILKNGQSLFEGKVKPEQLGARAVDAKTLELTLEHPAPYMLQLTKHQTFFPVPRHVVEKLGSDWVKAKNYAANGPYKLAEWVPNSMVKLVKNPTFYDAANVQVDVIYYLPISDPASELKRYQAGELDATSTFPARQKDSLKAELGDQVHINSARTSTYAQINITKKPFNDVRVRRALALAIEREAICYQLLNVGQTPAYSFVPPTISNYPNRPKVDFEPLTMDQRRAEAKKLLADAGYGPQNPLKFTYRYFDSLDLRRVATAMQSMWKDIGVNVQILNSEAKVQYDALRTQNFDVATAGWVADFDDAENFLYLFQTSTGAMNYSKYSNAEFDQLIEQANHAASGAERAQLLAQAEAILLKELPFIPIDFGANRGLVKPYVKGWVDNPGDWHRTRYISIDRSAAPTG